MILEIPVHFWGHVAVSSLLTALPLQRNLVRSIDLLVSLQSLVQIIPPKCLGSSILQNPAILAGISWAGYLVQVSIV